MDKSHTYALFFTALKNFFISTLWTFAYDVKDLKLCDIL